MFRRDLWWSIGLGTAAFFVGGVYVAGGFLERHELYFAPAAVAVLAASLYAGIRRSASASPSRRLRSGAAVTIVVAIVGLLPPAARWAWLTREIRAIPLPADADDVASEVELPLFDPDGTPFAVRCSTQQSLRRAADELRRGALSAGWKVEEARTNHVGGPVPLPSLGVVIPAAGAEFISQYATKGDRKVHFWVGDFGDFRQVLITATPRPKPAGLKALGL